MNEPGLQAALISLDEIHFSKTNPRKNFDSALLNELAESIKKHGLLHPLLVRTNGKGSGYELVAGERRVRAAKLAGKTALPAFVRDLDDAEVMEIQIIENLQRHDLHPLEEARGYHALMGKDHDAAWIAGKIGRSVRYVYDRVKLLSLTKQAQDLFLEGKFTAGHAILLARLKPEDQKRAIGGDDREEMRGRPGGLFAREHTLFDPRDDDDNLDAQEPRKPVSVREFDAWIADHVKFDREQVDPMLFPETFTLLEAAKAGEEPLKIVPITYDYRPGDDIRAAGKERIYGERAWKRADGSKGAKECERSRVGVIVCGPGRGEAFKVCIDKEKCKVHWASEQREKARQQKAAAKGGSTGEERHARQQEDWKKQREKEEAERARWEKALPAILDAVAEKVKKAPGKATGLLADLVINGLESYSARSKDAQALMPRGKTAEDLVRHAAFIVLMSQAKNYYGSRNLPKDYYGSRNFPKRARAFGVDVKKILEKVAPAEKDEKKAK